MNSTARFDDLETLFRALYAAIGDTLSAGDLNDSRDFFAAREYGLALDTILDSYVEEAVQPPISAVSLIDRLAELMHIAESQSLRRFRRFAARD